MFKSIKFVLISVFITITLITTIPADARGAEKFIIINLHAQQDIIAVNSLKIVSGTLKKRRGLQKKGDFAYRIISKGRQVLAEQTFEVPFTMHYDFIDEKTGNLQGGTFMRPEADFVLKIPVTKRAQKIIFYKLNEPDNHTLATDRGHIASGKAQFKKVVGEVLLPAGN